MCYITELVTRGHHISKATSRIAAWQAIPFQQLTLLPYLHVAFSQKELLQTTDYHTLAKKAYMLK